MRIEFANAVHADIDWPGGTLRVGRAADNDVVLARPDIAAHHVRLEHDARGLVLQVLPGAGRVYVNARPVSERALLRAGDTLGLGGCRLRLCAETAATPPPPREDGAAAALRAVAGPLSGRVVDIGDWLELGPQGRLPLGLGGTGAPAIARRDGALWLQAEALPAGIDVRINGLPNRHACLADGDQLVIGTHRFVVDAWIPPPRASVAAEPAGSPLPEDAAGARGEMWWLILTAAVLALVIALLLVVRL